MIKSSKVVELMNLDADGLTKIVNDSGYNDFQADSVSFVGINQSGHFVYRVVSDCDDEVLEFNMYVAYDHKTDTVTAEF